MEWRGKQVICLIGAVWLAGCNYTLPPAVPPAVPPVVVSRPIAREFADYEDYTGRTEAVSSVEIRPRVSGYLVKVGFKDGDLVQENDLLYQIDPRPFEDDLAQAKAEVERLEASGKYLELQVARYRKLYETRAASEEDLQRYLAQQAENVGALKGAQAKVGRAELDLEFSRITAPIAGRISRTLLTPGNLVTADTTLLTTIVSIDPMYAYFDIEEPTMLRIQKMIREGVIPSRSLHEVEVHMGLADDVEGTFPLRGTLDFVNNTVDPQTGTILVRGVFSNPFQRQGPPPLLRPGLFVRIRLPMGPRRPVLLITERAIGTDQGRKFVYVLDKANKVLYRPVRLGLVFDGLQAIEEGLQTSERVVVNGLQRIRPGIEVQPSDVDTLTLAAPGGSPREEAGRSVAPVPAAIAPHSGPAPKS